MIYEYRCEGCQTVTEVKRCVAERDAEYLCDCGHKTGRMVSRPNFIFNSDAFPSQALRGEAFWRPDGRNLYFKEHEFLQREAADDAAARPETCTQVAKEGRAGQVAQQALTR